MANIMMTDVCNLHCPYCFANEFVNKNRNDITEENFDKAVDFILRDGTHKSIGLIGGEPTTHPQFEHLLKKLILNKKVEEIILYTNGIMLDKYWNVICHPKVKMLINCNHPDDIGKKNFQKLCDNIDYLIFERMLQDNITLGINLYCSDFKYEYIIDLLKKYHLHYLRVSITVPNIEGERNKNAHVYFKSMKIRMLEFFHVLLGNGIIPNFDCNKIPSCQISKQEIDSFNIYLNNEYIAENINRSNITSKVVKCSPVVDIMQDLTAVRCFGLSEYTKENIQNFRNITDLKNYYIRTIDAYAYNTVYSPKCKKCYLRKTLLCNGGCIAFKIADIVKMQKAAEYYIDNLVLK